MRRPSPATIIASIALFFSLAGTGLAASKYLITSTKQIKPSVLSSLHGARGAAGAQGAPGAQGAQGPAGTAGAAGAAGAAGTFTTSDLTTVTGTSTTILANANATSVATCPSGATVVGGGYSWGGTIPSTAATTSEGPQGTTGWAVTIQDTSGTNISTPFVAEAICAT